ncbi:archaeosortase A [Halosimplex aquaticum]|uniref:Archaeosortase A n=1 Tax=Halosimplex aquaticum TaxID=3026162 RepID=A0ABD5XVA4_9EURY|nr:archaeosortase A [Halosimplex aquaticum]
MIDGLLAGLEWATQFSDPLAWLVLAAFLVTAALDWHGERELARYVGVGGWALFGVFWFSLVYHFAFVQKSIIEGIGAVVAVPAAFYVGYLLWNGRDSLLVLSRAVLLMGVVFFPFESIPVLRQLLVETVTRQTEFLMALTGHHPEVANGAQLDLPGVDPDPYRNTFVFVNDLPYTGAEESHRITYTILIACTGIGSMSIFAGLIAAVDAPWRRKLRALAVSLPVIYVLNLFRNVFIGVTFGEQYLHVFPDLVLTVFGSEELPRVSYFVADRIIAQSLSVVALVGITYLVVRELPEVLAIIEDLLFVVTGSEYDLRAALEVPAVAADGGEESPSDD